ncbi:hypothetical protein AN641_01875 [Candidatus Epulonipiscioides gigas]|nr:hypothetical protein AN641_01875 [Epulopiscium sp. SCG-C07WGA-EpuloA2]
MEKALRKRFIISTVSIVFGVIFSLVFIINSLILFKVNIRINDSIKKIIANDGIIPAPKIIDINESSKFSILRLPPHNYYSDYFNIEISNNKIVANMNDSHFISSERAIEYANQILALNKSAGIIDTYKYKAITTENKTTIIYFIDFSPERILICDFFFNSLLVALIAFIAIFLLIFFYSKKVVSVIMDGYEKQQQFITGVTHELKTPLTIIKGNADVIGIQTGHTMWTKSIIEQINKLNVLIEYLIALTKLEETNVINRNIFSLSELLQETCIFFEGISRSKDKYIDYEIHPHILYNGDIQNIELLFSILLENAIKYSLPHSKIKICLRYIKNKPILYISNHAENLEIRQYDEWFDRFYRADASRNSNNSGFGIGLAMAKSIVVSHKGKIVAESLDGKIIIIKIIF